MLPKEIIALILAHLPWEEESDRLLPEYPFTKAQWLSYTKFELYETHGIIQHLINNRSHKEDGPAFAYIIPHDQQTIEYYYFGLMHRTDGPASVNIYSDVSRSERYYYMGHIHRNGGPAEITIKNNYCEELYYYMGLIYRDDGPAIVIEKPGYSRYEEWWHMGIHLSSTPTSTIQIVEF
jgi:hypothetical protein